MDGPADWPRLGEAIRDRRNMLSLSVRAAASIAGVDRETWGNAEAAKRQLSARNWSGFERALGWEAGSIARILDGGEATLAAGTAEPRPGSLAAEIERVNGLPLPPAEKIRVANALIAMYEERAREPAE